MPVLVLLYLPLMSDRSGQLVAWVLRILQYVVSQKWTTQMSGESVLLPPKLLHINLVKFHGACNVTCILSLSYAV